MPYKLAMAALRQGVSFTLRLSVFTEGLHSGSYLRPITSRHSPGTRDCLAKRRISTVRGDNLGSIVTLTKLESFEAHLHVDDNNVIPGSSRRPLVLVVPFLGAGRTVAQKYGALYRQLGADVVYVTPINLAAAMLPGVFLPGAARRLVHLLQEDGPIAGRRFMIHAMSAGFFFIGCLMEELARTQGRSPQNALLPRTSPISKTGLAEDGGPTATQGSAVDDIRSRLAGVVYDSPVIEGASVDPEVAMTWVGQPLAQWALYAYFAFLPGTATYSVYDRLSEAASRLDRSPKLVLHSRRDCYSHLDRVQSLAARWHARDVPVKVATWDDAPHAQLFPTQPKRYKQELSDFMRNLKLIE